MPLPNQYQVLQQALNSPTSRLETFREDSKDPFTDVSVSKCHGMTYCQMAELYHKNRDLYDEIFHDSAFD